MALQWIIGDFKTGNITETAVLPTIAKDDKVSIDVNSGDSATLTVSKNDLPSDFKTYLKPLEKFVALVDTELAFGTAVVWAGFINKFNAKVNGTIQIQAAGLKEYMAARIISQTYNTTVADPDASLNFSASSWAYVEYNLINTCFSSTGAGTNDPKPPVVLGNISGSNWSGTTCVYNVKLSDFETYSNALDEVRDKVSNGEEYVFKPRWSTSAKTRIVWDTFFGSSSTPHINEKTTQTIQISDNSWKPLVFSQSASTDNLVSRVIAQSKEGANGTGSDYISKTSTTGTSILLDSSFNPGVELTTDQLNSQVSNRLSYNSQLYKEAEFERVYNDTLELKTILGYLGCMATFTGVNNTASQYFGLSMRIVGISFSPNSKKITLELAPKAAKYPKLPKDKDSLKKNSETSNTGRSKNYGGYNNGGGYDGDRSPIVSTPIPGSNGSDIPGGLNGTGIKPNIPKQDPNIPKQDPFAPINDTFFEDPAKPAIKLYDIRVFDSAKDKAIKSLNKTRPTHKDTLPYYRNYPSPKKARHNIVTNEYVGLNYSTMNCWLDTGSINTSDIYNFTLPDEFADNIKIYSINFKNMFDKSALSYAKESVYSATTTADNYVKEIGKVPFEMYKDLIMTADVFTSKTPALTTNYIEYTPATGKFDYSFWTNEAFTEYYVQILFTASRRQTFNKEMLVYSASFSKVLKGNVDSSTGTISSWESLGQVFTNNANTEGATIMFSPSIYHINGEYKAFGAYSIPQAINGVVSNEVLPGMELKFYNNKIYNVNMSNGYGSGTTPNLPGSTTEFFSKATDVDSIKRGKYPYAVRVDYKNRKILLGYSRAENNVSVFYSANFNDAVFSKIMETNRQTNQELNKLFSGNFINKTKVDTFKFSQNSPVFYKNNYLMLDILNPNKKYDVLYSMNTEEVKEKKVSIIRSKEGVSGTKQSENLEMNDSRFGTSTTAYNAVGNSFVINNGNHLSAFAGLRFTGISIGNEVEIPEIGIDFLIIENELYLIYDATYNCIDDFLHDLNSTDFDGTAVTLNKNVHYWVAKYTIKEENL